MEPKNLRPELIQAFGVPIVAFDLPEHESVAPALCALILERRSGQPGLSRSNVGGWHSGEDLIQWGGRGARYIAQTFGEICSGLTELPRSGPHSLSWVVRMWANVSEAGAFNRQHFHPGAFWSAVYYVSDGRNAPAEDVGADLILHSPHERVSSMYAPDVHIRLPDGQSLSSTMVIKPRPGLGVIFPSWITHEVDAYRGAGQRISIALNFSLAPRFQGS
jgi:uncharacterized protein (TIGR02466 family)